MDALRPDVSVLAPDRPDVMLVVEVRRGLKDRSKAEHQLRRYMLDHRCPFALIVTPSTTWMYRDTFEDFSDASIVEVGEFATAEFFALATVPSQEVELTAAVREWLEHLTLSGPLVVSTEGAPRKPVVEHLVPAVYEGRILSSPLA